MMKLPSLLTLPLLASPLFSQVNGMPLLTYTGSAVHPASFPWPGQTSGQPGNGRLVAGRFTGNHAPDLVGIDAGKACLLTAPAIHTSSGDLPQSNGAGTVLDVATLRGHASAVNPSIDTLAMVSASGLWLWRRNELQVISLSQIGTSAWNGATRVRTHAVDNTTIYGRAANGTSIVRAFYSGGVWTQQSTINVGRTIFDLCAVDRDGDGLAEVAAITDRGLRVYARTGALVDSVSQTITAGAITAVRVPGLEFVSWVHPKTGTTGSELRSHITSTQVVDLGSRQLTMVSAGDGTYDGREDLVLGGPTETELVTLFNIGAAGGDQFSNSWGTGARVVVTDGVSTSGFAFANAMILDLDLDGDGDIVAPSCVLGGATRLVFRARSTVVDNPTTVTCTRIPGTPNVEFHFPVPISQTHTEIVIWAATPGAYPLAPTPVAVFHITPPASGNDQSFTFTTNTTFLQDGGSYHFLVRPVVMSSGVVVQAAWAQLGDIRMIRDGGTSNGNIVTVLPTPPLPPSPPPAPPNG